MWRIAFAVLASSSSLAHGQSREVPGRDLLNFPLGLTAESAPLGSQAGTGLWNPATAWLADGARWRVSASAMNASPDDIGVSAQAGAVAGVWMRTTIGLTLAHAAVADLLRTDDTPQSVGEEITYATTVLSLIVARRVTPHVVAGVALRSRSGRVDDVQRTSTSLDAGFIAEHLGPLDARVGASTFLFSQFGGNRDRGSFSLGADVRVAGDDSLRAVRAGYAIVETPGLSTEHYVFGAARWGQWEGRGGPVSTQIYGSSNIRLRLGVAVRHAGYALGVSREEAANGLAPTYHFSLSSVLR